METLFWQKIHGLADFLRADEVAERVDLLVVAVVLGDQNRDAVQLREFGRGNRLLQGRRERFFADDGPAFARPRPGDRFGHHVVLLDRHHDIRRVEVVARDQLLKVLIDGVMAQPQAIGPRARLGGVAVAERRDFVAVGQFLIGRIVQTFERKAGADDAHADLTQTPFPP